MNLFKIANNRIINDRLAITTEVETLPTKPSSVQLKWWTDFKYPLHLGVVNRYPLWMGIKRKHATPPHLESFYSPWPVYPIILIIHYKPIYPFVNCNVTWILWCNENVVACPVWENRSQTRNACPAPPVVKAVALCIVHCDVTIGTWTIKTWRSSIYFMCDLPWSRK